MRREHRVAHASERRGSVWRGLGWLETLRGEATAQVLLHCIASRVEDVLDRLRRR